MRQASPLSHMLWTSESGIKSNGVTFGPFSSVSTFTLGPGPGVPNCPCSLVSSIAWFPNDTTLTLANGYPFKVWKNIDPLIVPLPGNSTVIAGQSTPIINCRSPRAWHSVHVWDWTACADRTNARSFYRPSENSGIIGPTFSAQSDSDGFG